MARGKDGVELDVWSFERENAVRHGLRRLSKSWARSLADHAALTATWSQMAVLLVHCKLLMADVHNLCAKALRLTGFDAAAVCGQRSNSGSENPRRCSAHFPRVILRSSSATPRASPR
jgi:hypothetical protein